MALINTLRSLYRYLSIELKLEKKFQYIDKLEKKLNTTVLSSNQALIWDTLVKINKNNSVEGFGKLFKEN